MICKASHSHSPFICTWKFTPFFPLLADLSESRLKMAKTLGADGSVVVSRGKSAEDLRVDVMAAFGKFHTLTELAVISPR